MSSTEDSDYAANLVLRESHQLIADHINVDCIGPSLYQKHCLSLKQLQYLQNRQGNLTDQDKKEYLLNNVLMNGGYTILRTLLDTLDETSQELQPHANLAFRLKKQYHDLCNQADQKSAKEPQSSPETNPPTNFTQSLPQIPDIIPQIFSQLTQSLGSAAPPVATKSDERNHSSASGPACNYFIALSGTVSPSYSRYSSSLNDDVHIDHVRESTSSKPSRSESCISPSVFNYNNFEGIDEEPADEPSFTSQGLSFVDLSPRKLSAGEQHHNHCHHGTAPAMLENVFPPGTATVSEAKQSNAIKKKTKDVSSNRGEVTKRAHYNLNDFDILRVLNKSNEPLPNMVFMKLILLGESGVGKTSIVKRFLYDDFEQTQVTIGSAHETCYCNHATKNVNINLAIWDTAGQEKFHSICKMYYHDADAVLLVFDITNRESLHAAENYWHKALKQNLSKADVPIVLVGNKCDDQVATEEIRKEAKQIVQKCGFKDYRETSAKHGFEVDAVFEAITSLALESENITHCQDTVKLKHQPCAKQQKKCHFC